MISGWVMPSGCSVALFAVPWSDSTLPIAASVVHARWQAGASAATRSVAYPYAFSAVSEMPTAGDIRLAHCATTSCGGPTGRFGSLVASGFAPLGSGAESALGTWSDGEALGCTGGTLARVA